jgi:hypothetical protein
MRARLLLVGLAATSPIRARGTRTDVDRLPVGMTTKRRASGGFCSRPSHMGLASRVENTCDALRAAPTVEVEARLSGPDASLMQLTWASASASRAFGGTRVGLRAFSGGLET